MCEINNHEEQIKKIIDKVNKQLMEEGVVYLKDVRYQIYKELGIIIFDKPWSNSEDAVNMDFSGLDKFDPEKGIYLDFNFDILKGEM